VRKVILIACVVALLVMTAGAAMASKAYWVVKFRAGVYDPGETDGLYTSFGNVVVGASSSPSTSLAPNPVSTAANLSTVVGAANYGTERKDSDVPEPYTFTMAMAVGSLYPDPDPNGKTVWISAWSPDSYLGATGRALPSNWRVTVKQGDTVLASWNYNDLFWTADPATTAIGKVGFRYTFQERNDAWAGVDKDLFTVIVAPEPGSILALSSGLIGLAGYALRRRRKA